MELFSSRSDRKAWWVIGIVLLLFFCSKWVVQGLWFTNDLVRITSPLEDLYAHIQRSGESPLWAPELVAGYPLLANGQLNFWYPPHMLLRTVFPGIWTLNISLFLHSILAAGGMYVWLRQHTMRRSAALSAALLFVLSGAMTGKYEMMNLLLPFFWLPLLFFFLEQFFIDGRIRTLTWWGVAHVFCVLAGHPQTILLVFLGEALFVISFLFRNWRYLSRALATLLGVGAIIGMTLPFFLPVMDVVPDTDRAHGLPTDELLTTSFAPKALLGLFVAHPFGHGENYQGPKSETELSVYVGPVVLLLAVFGFFVGRKRFPRLWLFALMTCVVGVTLALGEYSPVYRFLVEYAQWRYFQAPARFFLIAYPGIALFFALGFHMLIERFTQKRALVPILFLTTLAPVFLVGWTWYKGIPWHIAKAPVLLPLLQQEGGLIRLFSKPALSNVSLNDDFGINVWNAICSTCHFHQTFIAPFPTIEGIALKLSRAKKDEGTVRVTLFDSSGKKIREASRAVTKIKDGEWNEFRFLPLRNIEHQPFSFEVTSTLAGRDAPRLFLHTNPGGQQYDPTGVLTSCVKGNCTPVTTDEETADAAFASIPLKTPDALLHETFVPYAAAGFGLGSAQWAGSLSLPAIDKYLKPLASGAMDNAWEEARSLVNRFPITHAVGVYPPYRAADNLPGFSEVGAAPMNDVFVRLYKNNEAFPRLHFAEHVQAVQGRESQRKALFSLNPKDDTTVVADVPHDEIFSSGGSIRFLNDKRTHIAIATKRNAPGFVVLRDAWFRGWEATLDGTPVPIHRVDSLFRGIPVPAGEHTIDFRYHPAWLRLALKEEILLLPFLGIVIFLFWRKTIRMV